MKMKAEELKKLVGDVVKDVTADRAKADEVTDRRYTGPVVAPSAQPVEDKAVESGSKAARAVRYLLMSRGDLGKAVDLAKKDGHQSFSKQLGETIGSAGGFLLPTELSAEIVELLRPATVVRAAGATVLPMNTGSLDISYFATGSAAAYTGENTNANKTERTFGIMQLHDHKLTALVPVSNDLIRNGGTRVEMAVRDDIVRALSQREDLAFIRGDGTSNTPKGMLYWATAGNKFDANGTVTVPNVTDDLGTAVFTLENGNVPTRNAAWIFSPRTKKYLMTARDGNNNLVWATEMGQGTLMGYPWFTTTQIPNNLGTGTDESEIYFAAMDSLVIAENERLMIDISTEGSWNDGGTLRNAFSEDQTLIRAINVHDFGARQRGTEIAVIEAVKWGA